MLRKRKIYEKPRKLYDKARIEDENLLLKKYGLKNKREIWKADAKVDKIRRQAKKLITAKQEEQEEFIGKLAKQGFNVKKIADVLSLTKEDLLDRRLQSVIVRKRIAKTPKEARQLISHKHIAIEGNVINIPSYLVPLDKENKIALELKRKLKEKEIKKEKKREGEKINEDRQEIKDVGEVVGVGR